jgi:hypothetical protein
MLYPPSGCGFSVSADIDDRIKENVENIQKASSDFINREKPSPMTVIGKLKSERPAIASA